MDEEALKKLKADVRYCLELRWMAYHGNCEDRQALRLIEGTLAYWIRRWEAEETQDG